MDKMIVVVFDGENQAREGTKALRELHDEGSISVLSSAVVTRDNSEAAFLNVAEVGADFIGDVNKALTSGKSAVVAEVNEEWVTPVDTRMHKLGGTVLRHVRWENIDNRNQPDIAASKHELEAAKGQAEAQVRSMETQAKQASGETKSRIESRLQKAKAWLKRLDDKIKHAA